jgi:transcriptional regulator with XRE-family HTH domain
MDAAPGASGQPENGGRTDPADRAAFGDFVRQARERRQLTVEQIASDTKIPSRHLTALEQGDVTSLPGGMYRRAMLRAYAESIGLDKDSALANFERTFEPRPGGAAPRGPAVTTRAAAVQKTAPAAAPAPDAAAAPVPERTRGIRVPLMGVVITATVVVAFVTGDGDRSVTPRGTDAAASTVPALTTPGDVSPAIVEPARANDNGVGGATDTPPSADLGNARAASPAAGNLPAVPLAQGDVSGTPPRPATPGAESGADAVMPATGGAVAANARAAVRATAAEIAIVSEPAGARVTIDGTGWGTTPVTVRHLSFGSKRVRVTRDGYLSQERAISVSPERPAATMRITLEPRD